MSEIKGVRSDAEQEAFQAGYELGRWESTYGPPPIEERAITAAIWFAAGMFAGIAAMVMLPAILS